MGAKLLLMKNSKKALLVSILITVILAFPATGLVHAASAWNVQTLDKMAYDSGKIALDSNSNPHIVYDEFLQGTFHQNSNVMYASWTGSAWNIQNVTEYNSEELSSDSYFGSAMVDFALDANGNPHILFNHDAGGGLYYAYLNGSTFNIQTIDPNANTGSIALDSEGNPHVAYAEGGNASSAASVKYASWTGSSWDIQTVDEPNSYSPWGPSISLQLDSNNNPHIMYETFSNITPLYGPTASDIRYAVSNGSKWTVQTVFENVSISNMVLDRNGYPHVVLGVGSGENTTSVYASWDGKSWINQTLSFNANGYLTLDSNDNPHIDCINYAPDSFIGALMYASWTGKSWNIQTVDPQRR